MDNLSLQQKIDRLESENLRLRSLLAKETKTNQLLEEAIHKPHFLSRIVRKLTK